MGLELPKPGSLVLISLDQWRSSSPSLGKVLAYPPHGGKGACSRKLPHTHNTEEDYSPGVSLSASVNLGALLEIQQAIRAG